MKLIPMTDFVLYVAENADNINQDYAGLMVKYAEFLKQPLELWMFVPCVDNEPFNYSNHGNKEQFEKAKEKVLFEGFEVDELILKGDSTHNVHNTILSVYWQDSITEQWRLSRGLSIVEHLVIYGLTLTETAIKQLEL